MNKRKRSKKTDKESRINKPLFYQDLLADTKSDIDFTKLSEKQLYENVSYPKARDILLQKYEHNPSLWLHQFHNSKVPRIKQALRILIGRQTLNTLNKQQYLPTSSQSKPVTNITYKTLISIAKSTKYYQQKTIPLIKYTKYNAQKQTDSIWNDEEKKEISTKNINPIKNNKNIFTINADCIDVGCLLQNRGYNPIILNMANENHAGGGWERGSGAQEENIFRRTSYVSSLCNTINNFQSKCFFDKKRKWTYPITEFGCIYSPHVFIFRSNESSGYKYLKCAYTLSFIAAAMYRFPKIDEETRRYKDENIEKNIKRKIRSLLRVSYLNGHNCLVMSAWGCGAFRNPPEHQAELWYEVLIEKEFHNVFDCIVFAILDDHNARKKHNPNGNYKPFVDVFGESRLLESC